MSDYKSTLNLPQTDFPMKANLREREPRILKKWTDIELYAQLRKKGEGKKRFVLHLGPPYANGHIHLGTATTTILKDIIVKAKTLFGFDAPLVPGWDCHGLPIELNVEKKIGKPGRKVSVEEFRAACRDYATGFIKIQKEEFKRLGIVADWQHPYLTMDFKYEADIVRALAKIIDAGHLEKGGKPIQWCLDCASSLAEAEVEYQDKRSPSIDVRFEILNKALLEKILGKSIKQSNLTLPIWTTTPWSLPGNQAVALNPLVDYAIVAADTEVLIIAKDLLEPVLKRYALENTTVLDVVRGEALAGLELQHPFYEKTVPLIMSDHVTVDAGTGAVHIAPAHGPDDYLLGKKYELSLENPVGDDGCFTSRTPYLAGTFVGKVNDKILELLREKGTLIHETTLTHSYPHCWRHKTPIIYRATPQWFISMDKNGLREEALQGIERVKWIPDWGKNRITAMIATRPDWCISRQRTWGVPLCLVIHKETGELHQDTTALMQQVADKIEKEGVQAWYDLDLTEILGEASKEYRKVTDVLDVWFDSGVSHECVLKARKDLKFPADIVLEGSDQHRGWFQSSLLTSTAINHEESYKQVLTHGFVVDGQGRKMSKSLGNVIAPNEIVDTLGADILRLWVASVDYRYDINASKEILSRMSEAYRRIRNTARFLLANLKGFDPAKNQLQAHEMLSLDRFIVHETKKLQQEIEDAYNTYQFHLIIQKLHNFCVSDLGGFYLDIIKDRQYTMPAESRGRRSAQTALYHIAQAFVRWMAPIMSFTAEEIWQYLPGDHAASVLLAGWYDGFATLTTDDLMDEDYWMQIREIRDAVNKEIEAKRDAGLIGSALQAEVYLYCDEDKLEKLNVLQHELRFVLITSKAVVLPLCDAPDDAVQTALTGLFLRVNATTFEKCERCWHRQSDVSKNPDYPGICGRCVTNIQSDGEIRNFA